MVYVKSSQFPCSLCVDTVAFHPLFKIFVCSYIYHLYRFEPCLGYRSLDSSFQLGLMVHIVCRTFCPARQIHREERRVKNGNDLGSALKRDDVSKMEDEGPSSSQIIHHLSPHGKTLPTPNAVKQIFGEIIINIA